MFDLGKNIKRVKQLGQDLKYLTNDFHEFKLILSRNNLGINEYNLNFIGHAFKYH